MLISCPCMAGSMPNCPTGTSVFCASMALITEAEETEKSLSLFGSSQMRMAYCEPNKSASPTPLMRLTGSNNVD